MAKNNKKTTKKNGKQMNLIPLVVLLGIAACSGAVFAKDAISYVSAKNEYAEIQEMATVTAEAGADEEEVIETAPAAKAEEVSEEITVSEDTEVIAEEIVEEFAAEIDYPAMDIDFEALSAVNGDLAAWIYIPALDLSYPVVQGEDNSRYLSETFEGSANAAGSIFMDCNAAGDLTDDNTFIFGHNMKNLSMFGSLKRFEREDGLCAADPYIYLYTDGAVYKYHIFSYAPVAVDDVLYDGVSNGDAAGYDEYVQNALDRSEYEEKDEQRQDDFSARPKLLTLNTCYATGHTHNFVVTAVLVGVAD